MPEILISGTVGLLESPLQLHLDLSQAPCLLSLQKSRLKIRPRGFLYKDGEVEGNYEETYWYFVRKIDKKHSTMLVKVEINTTVNCTRMECHTTVVGNRDPQTMNHPRINIERNRIH